MKALYDQQPIELTDRFVAALKELLLAELEMMRQNEPDQAHCWTWGICRINDLANMRGLDFEFGGEEDRPAELQDFERVKVIANE